ncbi:MAG: phenylalanine--tRNA ligase subunit alpha [Patescibacteria group bacterium]|jgi:phenylalanyl-tRNA synthetase alpha chain
MDVVKLDEIQISALKEISEAADAEALETLRIKYLGKKGILADLTGSISSVPNHQKKEYGTKLNEIKETILGEFVQKGSMFAFGIPAISGLEKGLPGNPPKIGHLHVITQAIREIVDIFRPLGFTRTRYPEIEWEYFAFDALNMDRDHPARDEWETFFVDAPESKEYGKMVITPHTSSGQVREMLKGELPIRMLNISRCGRRQVTVKHLPTFFQFEGLVVDEGINITHLKGVLNYFVKNFFGDNREIRLRPYDFRFTEPSFEVDISCDLCHGKGCRFCKEGWVELGGAGMVHPNVLKSGGIDPEKYSGFAFGWGVERTYMMKAGTQIDDIRHIFANDIRFLEQF